MRELAFLSLAYIGIGLVCCITLAFRTGKNPRATKAIYMLLGFGAGPFHLLLGVLLWPIWAFVQLAEEDVVEPPEAVDKGENEERLDSLVGRIGTTLTPMRPSGRIRLDGKAYEALSDEGALDRDEAVQVLAISMGRLRVRRLRPGGVHGGGQRPTPRSE